MLNITVNGQARQLSSRPCVASLVEEMQLDGKRFAVERNGEIVPKSRLSQVQVEEGDVIEIVVAVGGG